MSQPDRTTFGSITVKLQWAGEGATGEPGAPSEARRGGFPRHKKSSLALHRKIKNNQDVINEIFVYGTNK